MKLSARNQQFVDLVNAGETADDIQRIMDITRQKLNTLKHALNKKGLLKKELVVNKSRSDRIKLEGKTFGKWEVLSYKQCLYLTRCKECGHEQSMLQQAIKKDVRCYGCSPKPEHKAEITEMYTEMFDRSFIEIANILGFTEKQVTYLYARAIKKVTLLLKDKKESLRIDTDFKDYGAFGLSKHHSEMI